MNYTVIDTETSGLFDFKQPADAPGQPRLASLAMIHTDENGNEESRHEFYVKPDGWTMDPGASAVNGLTDAFLQENGLAVEYVIDQYEAAIKDGRTIAAFNAQFDCKVMRAEFRRAGQNDLFTQTPNTCLMRAAQKLGPYGFKSATPGWPKLVEVAAFFGHTDFDEHDALADAEAARIVLVGLIGLDAVIPPKVHYAKNRA